MSRKSIILLALAALSLPCSMPNAASARVVFGQMTAVSGSSRMIAVPNRPSLPSGAFGGGFAHGFSNGNLGQVGQGSGFTNGNLGQVGQGSGFSNGNLGQVGQGSGFSNDNLGQGNGGGTNLKSVCQLCNNFVVRAIRVQPALSRSR